MTKPSAAQSKLAKILAKRRAQNDHPATGSEVSMGSDKPELPKISADISTEISGGNTQTGHGDSEQSKIIIQSAGSIQSKSEHPLSLAFLELQESINAGNPEMPYILQRIHKDLAADFELVTLLTEEEIGLFVSGLKVHTGVTIKANPKKSQKGKSQPIDLSMLD